MVKMPSSMAALFLALIFVSSSILGTSLCNDDVGNCDKQPKSEDEIEQEEDMEAMLSDVQLLQMPLFPNKHSQSEVVKQKQFQGNSVQNSTRGDAIQILTTATAPELRPTLTSGEHASVGADVSVGKDITTPQVETSTPIDPVSLDHNGHMCMLCNKPLPTRVGNKTYAKFRKDCGGRSSPTGPKSLDMQRPLLQLTRPAEGTKEATNGFCELNFAKSCADAITNEDYLYWPKSLDMTHPIMQGNIQWDALYCLKNDFLQREIVALQHNFTGMRRKASDLCSTKYAKYNIEKLTFLDMMRRTHHDGSEGPSLEDAELLAAWNCAMGDLGCDMAMCAYSFCEKDNGSVGLYDECVDWHPIHGMPVGE